MSFGFRISGLNRGMNPEKINGRCTNSPTLVPAIRAESPSPPETAATAGPRGI